MTLTFQQKDNDIWRKAPETITKFDHSDGGCHAKDNVNVIWSSTPSKSNPTLHIYLKPLRIDNNNLDIHNNCSIQCHMGQHFQFMR